MKKFIAILLALLLPVVAIAAPSPSVEDLISSLPAIPFEVYEYNGSWHDLLIVHGFYLDLEEGFKDVFADGVAQLDELLIITLNQEYEDVEWFFTTEYKRTQAVMLVLVDEEGDYQMYESGGITLMGSVFFDFSDIPFGTYYMLVFSGNRIA